MLKKHERSQSARNSVRSGKDFEILFKNKCEASKSLSITRIPDGCRVIGPGKLVRVRSDFDWVVSREGGEVALIDTKTTQETRFHKRSMNLDQIEALVRHEQRGVHAGFVIHFSTLDLVIFVYASTLKAGHPIRGFSIGPEHGIDLGSSQRFDPELIFW